MALDARSPASASMGVEGAIDRLDEREDARLERSLLRQQEARAKIAALSPDEAHAVLHGLRDSIDADVLRGDYPPEMVDAELRAAGGDPEAIAKRGRAHVNTLLAARKDKASASARMALDDRQMALDDSRPVAASASARMALDSPPVAASASARMALDTDTEANRKSRDVFDAQAYDLLATRNAASARGEAVQSIEALFAEELRGRCRALKSVDGLANALAAACDEISAHDACAATLEGEYAVHRTPPERVAEWRKLAQEQA
jgi:hypothetical protein